MEEYYEKNLSLQARFYSVLDNNADATFRDVAKKLHNRQWSEHIHNIANKDSQCPNHCRYCYMETIRMRFYGAAAYDGGAATATSAVSEERANKKWPLVHGQKRGAVARLIMFPSSHDIIADNVDAYIKSARLILEAGHSILLVSKPRMDVLLTVDDALRDRIIYRFTISTTDQTVADYWETNAPPIAERIAVLRELYMRGCMTSVSMEPFLTDPEATIAAVYPYVSESVWIGPMSGKFPPSDESAKVGALYKPEALAELVSRIRAFESSHAMSAGASTLRAISMCDAQRRSPIIMWKTSVMLAIVDGC